MTKEDRVAELVLQGAVQVSRKYRLVARLPPGMTGLQALRERAPELHAHVMHWAEDRAADTYRRLLAEKHGDMFELSQEEFEEFRREKEGAR